MLSRVRRTEPVAPAGGNYRTENVVGAVRKGQLMAGLYASPSVRSTADYA
jgi:hypothetical protein